MLRAAGKTLKQIVAETGVSQRSVQRIERERPIEDPGDLLQACERGTAAGEPYQAVRAGMDAIGRRA